MSTNSAAWHDSTLELDPGTSGSTPSAPAPQALSGKPGILAAPRDRRDRARDQQADVSERLQPGSRESAPTRARLQLLSESVLARLRGSTWMSSLLTLVVLLAALGLALGVHRAFQGLVGTIVELAGGDAAAGLPLAGPLAWVCGGCVFALTLLRAARAQGRRQAAEPEPERRQAPASPRTSAPIPTAHA